MRTPSGQSADDVSALIKQGREAGDGALALEKEADGGAVQV